MKLKIPFLIGAILIMALISLHAGEAVSASPTGASTKASDPFSLKKWWEGDSLTSDWFGQGETMRKHGFYLESTLTQYGQGLVSGRGNKDWEYGGLLDAFAHVEGQQMGTWAGLSLDSHLMFLYGQTAGSNGGMLSPTNTALLLPAANETIVTLSSLYLTQKFGEFSLSGGRFNTVDFYALDAFDGGRGVTSFWNGALVVPPIFARVVPPVTLGGMAAYNNKKYGVDVTLGVFDSTDSSTTTGLSDPFSNGVTLLGEVAVHTNFGGLKGKQAVTGVWSSIDTNSLATLRQLAIPALPGASASKDDAWVFYYNFEQYLFHNADDPEKGWGLFGSAGISDGNPNPIGWSATIGLGGNSMIPGRSQDKFGVGYYYLGISNAMENALPLLLPVRDEQGVEMFYTVAINKWWDVTGDLQVVDPWTKRNSTDVVAGLSTKIKF